METSCLLRFLSVMHFNPAVCFLFGLALAQNVPKLMLKDELRVAVSRSSQWQRFTVDLAIEDGDSPSHIGEGSSR